MNASRAGLGLVFIAASAVAHAQGAGMARACDADAATQRVCAVDDSLRVALVRADTATLARLYADDLETTNYRGVTSTKPGLLRAIATGTLRFDTLSVRWRIGDVRGDTALVTGLMHQVARGAEGAHPLEVRYVRTYVRAGGGWRLVRAALRTATPNDSLPPTR